MRLPTVDDVRDAARLIDGHVLRTPFLPAPRLSMLTGADVRVKYENLQVTAAFKERGALVKLASLGAGERARGVIAMSAGNHAQGVAYHARRLGIPCTIVMPVTTPYVKVEATRALGASVVLAGETLEAAAATARAAGERDGLVFVHPFDDFDVIRGQGTIALEMLADAEFDDIVVPIGGGGLIAGIGTVIKALAPRVRVIGVESEPYPSMRAALRGDVTVSGGPSLAEGIAVDRAGEMTRAIAATCVDDIVVVSESLIEQAINAYLTHQKTLAEGAGAAGLAALLAEPERFAGRRVALVLCGGNLDPRICASIMIRELTRAHRIITLRVIVPDRPKMLARIAGLIGDADGNILHVKHHRTFLDVPAKGTSMDIITETRDGAHADEIVAALAEAGFAVSRSDRVEV
ncbi:MAG: threonine ammonia-lyase [Hyphomicrobiaceae bacterium]|nr:threonine ammonia-lyase [Hyphomicrobiaceae bacterium]